MIISRPSQKCDGSSAYRAGRAASSSRPATHCGDHACRDPDHGSDQHRQERELERQRNPGDDRLCNRQPPRVGSQVALECEADPAHVLDGQRVVESVLLTNRPENLRIAVLGRVGKRGVARDRAHADKDEHAG
jgi:hypothetical protein